MLNDTSRHEIARALYFVKHRNWGYDPGNPKHTKWYDRALVFSQACALSTEVWEMSDGTGSSPPRRTDRSSTKRVRLVGGWRLSPSPASGLRSSASSQAEPAA